MLTDSPLPADAALRVLGDAPFNAETRLEEQVGLVTQAGRHYVRNHFAVPKHDGMLRIVGHVARPIAIPVEDLWGRASSVVVTLECAGNGRGSLQPAVPGEQWGLGAAGTAEWAGVPVIDLLAEAEPLPGTAELVFTGADEGLVGALGRVIPFQRSLPASDLAGALVVVGMNGARLTANHGAPVRLLVPGRYGMASVKWLSEIEAVEEPFRGFFQVDRYIETDGRPLGPIAPRAVIATPLDGTVVPLGPIEVRGYAWSGTGPITRVEVSADGGGKWSDADLGRVAGPTAWREWRRTWNPARAGQISLLARATDAGGRTQPLEQVHTPLGYGNNEARPTTVTVTG